MVMPSLIPRTLFSIAPEIIDYESRTVARAFGTPMFHSLSDVPYHKRCTPHHVSPQICQRRPDALDRLNLKLGSYLESFSKRQVPYQMQRSFISKHSMAIQFTVCIIDDVSWSKAMRSGTECLASRPSSN